MQNWLELARDARKATNVLVTKRTHMPTEAQVSDIVEEVRQRLATAASRGLHLKVSGNKLEDDWLYVIVTPSEPGESATEHARLMSQIERDLRGQGIDRLLLVPALED